MRDAWEEPGASDLSGRLQAARRAVVRAIAHQLDEELKARCAPVLAARPALREISRVQATHPPDEEDGARFHVWVSAPRATLASGGSPEALRLAMIAALQGSGDEELLPRHGDPTRVTVDRDGVHTAPWSVPDDP